MAYFDWNATCPMHEAAWEALREAQEADWANPSAVYRAGTGARARLEAAREELARTFGFLPEEVVFTSGASESNNAFLREMAFLVPEGELWISAVEHATVAIPAERWWAGRVRVIPVRRDGVLDMDWVEARLGSVRPALVSLMAANNETGVIQPWEEMARRCRERDIAFHCDAAQWRGRAPGTDFSGCSAVTLSGHKFGGPKGVGALLVKTAMGALRLLEGGAQEGGARAGTENVPAILAMVAALSVGTTGHERQGQWRDAFERRLLEAFPGLEVNGAAAPRLWNTCSLVLPDFPARRWILHLDRAGFQVSSGAACQASGESPSAVLRAMGLGVEKAARTVRISGGWRTSEADWRGLAAAILEVHAAMSAERADNPSTMVRMP